MKKTRKFIRSKEQLKTARRWSAWQLMTPKQREAAGIMSRAFGIPAWAIVGTPTRLWMLSPRGLCGTRN